MDTLIYQKSLEGQVLLIEQQNQKIIGSWFFNGDIFLKENPFDIQFNNFPLIKNELVNFKKMVLGFSKELQAYYAYLLNEDLSLFLSETGNDVIELLNKLNYNLSNFKTREKKIAKK